MPRFSERLRRNAVLVIASLCVLCAAAAIGVLVYLSSPSGERRIAELVRTATAEIPGWRIQLDGFEIGFPARVSASRVTIDNPDGSWLDADNVRVELGLWGLLGGTVTVRDAYIESLNVSDLPVVDEAADDEPVSWPRAVVVDRIVIAAGRVSGEPAAQILGAPSGAQGADAAALSPISVEGGLAYQLTSGRFDVDLQGDVGGVAGELRGVRDDRTVAAAADSPREHANAAVATVAGGGAKHRDGDDANSEQRSEVVSWSIGGAVVRVDVDDLLGRPHGRIAVELSEAVYADLGAKALKLQASLKTPSRLTGGGPTSFEATLQAAVPKLPAPADVLIGGHATVEAAGSFVAYALPLTLQRFEFRGAGLSIDADGRLLSTDGVEALKLRAELADLALLDAGVGGRAGLIAVLDGSLSDAGGLTADVDLRVSEIVRPQADDPLRQLGPRAKLTAQIAAVTVSDGSSPDLRVSDLELEYGQLRVVGAAAVAGRGRDLSGSIRATLADLSAWSAQLGRQVAGGAALDVALAGTQAQPSANAALSLPNLSVEGSSLRSATLRAAPLRLQPNVSASLVLDAQAGDGSIAGRGFVARRDDGGWALTDGELTTESNRVSLRAALAASGAVETADIEARLSSLAEIGAIVGIAMRGRADGEIRYADGIGKPSSADVRLAGVELTELGVAVHRLTGRASAAKIGDGGRAELAFESKAVRYGTMGFDAVSVRSRGSGERWRVEASVEEESGGVNVDAVVDADFGDDAIVAKLTGISGTLGGQPVSAEGVPVYRRSVDGSAKIDGRLRVGDGRVYVDWTTTADSQFGRVDADRFPLKYIGPLINPLLLIDGTAGANIVIPEKIAADAAPRISVQLDALRALSSVEFPGFDVGIDARRIAREVRVEGSVKSRLGGELKIDGTISANADGDTPLAGLDAGSALRARLHGKLGRRAIASLAALIDARLWGELLADVQLGGTLGEPSLDGGIKFVDGVYETNLIGARLTQIDAQLRAVRAGHAEIEVSATDGLDGRLSARGSLDVTRGLHSPLVDLACDLSSMRVARIDEAKVTVDGKLALRGDGTDYALSGNLKATEVELRIPERRPDDVVELNVVEVNAELLDRPPPAEQPASSTPPIALDITVEVPGPAFVRARDIATEWRGRVVVSGTARQPALDGKLELIRGELAALGTTIKATRGLILFDSTPWAYPLVDISGSFKRAGVEVIVQVAGPYNDLAIQLQSEPPMPQDEILSAALFGTNVADLTPIQAVQLGAAVAAFANPGARADPLGWVQRTTKLDRVGIGRKDGTTGEYVLSAGKYIRKGVYVSVDQPLGEGSRQASVELEVTDNVTLRSAVGADASGSVGATWSHDY